MSVRVVFLILVVVAALALAVVFGPLFASAFYLNLANASLAHAVTLPADAAASAGARALALAHADAQADHARSFAGLDRLALVEARTALARGSARAAVEALERAKPFRTDSMMEFVWGEAAWQAGRSEAAFEHWRRAGALVYFMQEAHRAEDGHDWARAADRAAIAAGIEPGSADAHFVLGDALSRQDAADLQAFEHLVRAQELTHDPEFLATVLSRQAEIRLFQGDWTKALDLFDAARRTAPLDARPRTGYATILLARVPARRDEALELLDRVTRDSPWYTAAFIALAEDAQAQGMAERAENWLKTGLQRNPNDARLLLPLGRLYARQGRIPEARATFVLASKYETHADDLQLIARELHSLDATP